MSCTCRDDQYQLCAECQEEQYKFHAPILCASCDDVISTGTLCQDCAAENAIAESKEYYAALYNDPSYKTHECLSCGTIIDTLYSLCSECESIADMLEYNPMRCSCDNDGSCPVCRELLENS